VGAALHKQLHCNLLDSKGAVHCRSALLFWHNIQYTPICSMSLPVLFVLACWLNIRAAQSAAHYASSVIAFLATAACCCWLWQVVYPALRDVLGDLTPDHLLSEHQGESAHLLADWQHDSTMMVCQQLCV
jgi:uncharacterized membrane protein YqjE